MISFRLTGNVIISQQELNDTTAITNSSQLVFTLFTAFRNYIPYIRRLIYEIAITEIDVMPPLSGDCAGNVDSDLRFQCRYIPIAIDSTTLLNSCAGYVSNCDWNWRVEKRWLSCQSMKIVLKALCYFIMSRVATLEGLVRFLLWQFFCQLLNCDPRAWRLYFVRQFYMDVNLFLI